MSRQRTAFSLAELASILTDEAAAYKESRLPEPVLTIVNSDSAVRYARYTLIITSRTS